MDAPPPPPPHLTERLVHRISGPETFQRGREYYERGAVLDATRRGNRFTASVEGSSYEPYRVAVILDAAGISSTQCTCPYDQGGACKHVIAALLYYINRPEQVQERPPLEAFLSGRTAEQLRAILLEVVEQHPNLADLVESQAILLDALPSPAKTPASTTTGKPGDSDARSGQTGGVIPPKRQTPLDPATYRRQVREALRSTDHMSSSAAYWQVGGIVSAVRSIAQQAERFLDAGDGRNAMTILQAVTEEYIAGWTYLDDSDGELGAFFEELGSLWAEAILTADLTPAERKTWAKRLSEWQREVDDYGIDEGFEIAETAARQGWDHPPLKRVLSGEISNPESWAADEDDEDDGYADSLTLARLNVLERQGRTQEYLYLAEAERQMDLYVTMLIKLGRVQEAVEIGMESLSTPQEAMFVAQALRERGAIEQAMLIAERGLSLGGGDATLAGWLRDLASGAGQPKRALGAALVAMRKAPGLENYRAVLALAAESGEEQAAIKEQMLASLRAKMDYYYPRAQIEIFLHEGMVDEAIATLEAAAAPRYDLVEMVADAAIETHPDWVITAAWRQAMEIIEAGKSNYYPSAARWLERARDASRVAGRFDEWRKQVEELLAEHKRKRNLVPLLEALLKKR